MIYDCTDITLDDLRCLCQVEQSACIVAAACTFATATELALALTARLTQHAMHHKQLTRKQVHHFYAVL